jgi:hypothetical protein
VQTQYPLYDDSGAALINDGTIHKVNNTDLIQTFINNGLLAEPPSEAAAADEAPADETADTTKPAAKSKARANAATETGEL